MNALLFERAIWFATGPLDIVPVALRRGERIFEDVPELNAQPVEVATSPLATHIVYRIT